MNINLFQQKNTIKSQEGLLYTQSLSYVIIKIFEILKEQYNGNLAEFIQEKKSIQEYISNIRQLEINYPLDDINILKINKIYNLSDFQFFCIAAAYVFGKDFSFGSGFSSEYVKSRLPLGNLLFLAYSKFIDYKFTKMNFIHDTSPEFLHKFFDMNNNARCHSFVLTAQISSYIQGGNENISFQSSYFNFIIPKTSGSPIIKNKIIHKLYCFERRISKTKNSLAVLYGEKRSGKKFHIEQFAAKAGKSIIYIKAISLNNGEPYINKITLQAELTNSIICVTGCDDFFNSNQAENIFFNTLSSIEGFLKTGRPVILIFNKKSSAPDFLYNYFEIIHIEIPKGDFSEYIEFWSYALQDINFCEKPDVISLVNKYNMNFGAIWNISRELAFKQNLDGKDLTEDMIYEKCNSFTDYALSNKASFIKAAYTWDDIIIEDKQKDLLLHATNFVKLKHIVYGQWGFKKRFPYGTGLNILFDGPPGTGKTMAAQVVSSELNIPLYRLDLSKILSKYIGETEEALREIFDAAEKSNVILFIDEMDALFGKRTEVKSSHERYSNMETSFLLQRIEQYSGIVIMATNYITNIDDAFIRRIHFIIHFAFPDAGLRIKLWKSMFPESAPVSNIDYKFLGNTFEIAGGNIKNIALNSAFMAAEKNCEINMQSVLISLKDELSKQGKILLKEDFGKYGYLVE